MLEAVTLPGVVVGFVLCIALQWLWAGFWIEDWALRALLRKRRLADVLYWTVMSVLVVACFALAVWALSDYLKLLAWSIRAGVY